MGNTHGSRRGPSDLDVVEGESVTCPIADVQSNDDIPSDVPISTSLHQDQENVVDIHNSSNNSSNSSCSNSSNYIRGSSRSAAVPIPVDSPSISPPFGSPLLSPYFPFDPDVANVRRNQQPRHLLQHQQQKKQQGSMSLLSDGVMEATLEDEGSTTAIALDANASTRAISTATTATADKEEDRSVDAATLTHRPLLCRRNAVPLGNTERDEGAAGDWAAAHRFKDALTPTVFSWNHGGDNVFVIGTFNDWKERIPLSRSRDDFACIIDLPEGTHQYKFIVDDEWVYNPDQPTLPDQSGAMNNYLTIDQSGSMVFDDLEDSSNSTPPGSYGHEIPTFDSRTKAPPALPPHLLQVILNAEPVVEDDPSVLPVPNHVLLNHLYALSIKDGVMVLASTHRLRDKYMTTVLYKPV